jgi:hypothetical protein
MDRDEAKLRVILDEDADMGRLYQEAYGDVKADKEADYNEAVRLQEKYSYNKHGLGGRKESEKYNLAEREKRPETVEEEMLTTEMSDEGLDLIYKRYKLMQWENDTAMRDAEGEAYELVQSFNAGNARSEDGEKGINTPLDLQNELGQILNKKAQRKRLSTKLE